MNDIWRAFGRGLIKLLVSLFAAIGVGLLVVANAARDDPRSWQSRDPPAGLFDAIAVGLLTAAVLLVVFFLIPWWWRKPASTPEPRDGEENIEGIRAVQGAAADRPREDRSSRFKAPPA